MQALKNTIESAFEERNTLSPQTVALGIKEAIYQTIELLDKGEIRVAEKTPEGWQIHEWIKKAVLLYFRTHDNLPLDGGITQYYDKVPLKFQHTHEAELKNGG